MDRLEWLQARMIMINHGQSEKCEGRVPQLSKLGGPLEPARRAAVAGDREEGGSEAALARGGRGLGRPLQYRTGQ